MREEKAARAEKEGLWADKMTASAKRTKAFKIIAPIIGVMILFSIVFNTQIFFATPNQAQANHSCSMPCLCGPTCGPSIKSCATSTCACQSEKDTPITIKHITDEFILHRKWLIKILWEAHVLPAMMLMTEQISAFSMKQMLIIGSLFDAKHQLETQRLLQDLQAEAHKNYQPSEGMCYFATNTRSLAASDKNAKFTQSALSSQFTQRQLMTGDVISGGGARDDSRSRVIQFRNTYCNPNDLSYGLGLLCNKSDVKRYNKDANYTQTIDTPKTLEIDFTDTDATEDEEDVIALSNNLYGHTLLSHIQPDRMTEEGNLIPGGAIAYMNVRAMTAKRSVAHAGYAAQTAMKAQGEEKVMPYMEAMLKEMGIEEEDIKTMLGERPSYFMQMEFLTKKLYQTPNFYAALYDKPVNIDRKNVSMQAIDLMQRRDMYKSQLRSEAMMSVWLETSLEQMEDLYTNETSPIQSGGYIESVPGLE